MGCESESCEFRSIREWVLKSSSAENNEPDVITQFRNP